MQITELQALIEPAVTALGFELVGCEVLKQGRAHLLRVYIDTEQGVNIDDCALASRQISAVLDVEDPFVDRYSLEVSSPGLDRPLFTLAHYQRFVGQRIRLKSRFAKEGGRRRFSGRLVAVEGDTIKLELDDEGQIVFTVDEIEKANIIADI